MRKLRGFTLEEKAFDVVTDRSAYWVGFLMADGCVTVTDVGSYLSLCLSETDEDHVKKFRRFLKSNHPLRYRLGGTSILGVQVKNPKRAVSLMIGCKYLCQSLEKFGVVPRKSYTAAVSLLENNRHFWRGVIDGDGSLNVCRGKGKRSFPRLILVGSETLLKQWASYLNKTFGISANVCLHNKRRCEADGRTPISVVSVTGKSAIDVIKHLYQDGDEALSRKSVLAKQMIEEFPYHSKPSREQREEARKISSEERKRAGLCAYIRCNELASTKYCQKHLESHRKTSSTRYSKSLSLGICPRCTSPVVEGKTLCQKHADLAHTYYERRAKKMLSQGLCRTCGSEAATNPDGTKKTLCERHLMLQRQYGRNRSKSS